MKKFSLPIMFVILLLGFYSSSMLAEHDAQEDVDFDRPEVIKVKDIRDAAQLAGDKNLPILLMFGTDECPYCELLKEDFLVPMLISGDYTDKVIIREVHIASEFDLIDFSGNIITIGAFSARYKVTLFPTMVFIDNSGLPLVENIIGITTPSLFGGTLDDRIDEALLLLRVAPSLKQ